MREELETFSSSLLASCRGRGGDEAPDLADEALPPSHDRYLLTVPALRRIRRVPRPHPECRGHRTEARPLMGGWKRKWRAGYWR
jgi:hypothetical protein